MGKGKYEFIVCAAIWYPTLRYSDPVAPDCNPINCSTGVVLLGLSHAQIIWKRVNLGLSREDVEGEQGFITNLNRFVDRKEAMRIAVNAKQLKDGLYPTRLLYSEDLFY